MANIFTLNGGIFTGCTGLKTVIIPAAEGTENVITFVGSAGSFPFDELAPEQLYALCLSKEVKFVDKVLYNYRTNTGKNIVFPVKKLPGI